jgi:uncharacterized protein
MRILIAGASGMVGQALVKRLAKNHELVLVGRNKQKLNRQFPHCGLCLAWDDLNNFSNTVDVVIHLSGQNVGNLPWFARVKEGILNSRINTAKRLMEWIQSNNQKPHIYAANAVGYYGAYADSPEFNEDEAFDLSKPKDFLQEVAFKWSSVWATQSPLTVMHFGVVLKKDAGMLGKLQPSFFMGMGAILGNGRQSISWIDIDDLVDAVVYLLEHPELQGHVNLVSPNPVTQSEFARVLAYAMKRPLWLTLPKAFVQMMFGEMGDALLLKGQKVYPKRLLDNGFQFKYPLLKDALCKTFSFRQ